MGHANNLGLLEAALDAVGDAIAIYDSGARLVFANRRYEELSGDAGGGEIVERPGRDGMPGKRIFRRSKHPLRNGAGETAGDLVVYRDVSGEMEAERMKAEVARLRSELETACPPDGLVGTSAPMRRVRERVALGAAGDTAVLITGATGTGKELVARSLHNNGAHKEGPFVAVHCAAVPEGLIEGELFGSRRRPSRGAARRRPGAFERARGGTLLLDGIGDLSPASQAMLLRVLREKEARPRGATAGRPAEARLIAAASGSLEEAVKAGSFREDLFRHLAAFTIAIPPLRERHGDIPLLAEYFLKDSVERTGKAIGGISTAALRALLQHNWPGNVRELKNAIERAVLLETSEVLQAGNLPPDLTPLAAARNGSGGGPGGIPPLAEPLAEIERQALIHALEASAGNVSEAARALGINRATLYRKLKKNGLRAGVKGR